MRFVLIGLAAACALLAGSLAAAAQESQQYPYCAEMKQPSGSGNPLTCLYRTLQQCQEAVADDQGRCVTNPAMQSPDEE